jgi:hypothetical protein
MGRRAVIWSVAAALGCVASGVVACSSSSGSPDGGRDARRDDGSKALDGAHPRDARTNDAGRADAPAVDARSEAEAGPPGNDGARPDAADGVESYTTDFPLTEDPISEGGRWQNGSAAGTGLWGDVQTTKGLAFGVSLPTTYGDPLALLLGTWGAHQTASATIRVVKAATSCCHEVELHLRMTIGKASVTGYEINCSVSNGNYLQVVRWNGPNGDYTYLGSLGTSCVDGDTLLATATGANPTTITVFKNGAQVLVATDDGGVAGGPGSVAGPWLDGQPGIGFFDDADGSWEDFGFSTFSATAD